jgi:chromosome partitioning protein
MKRVESLNLPLDARGRWRAAARAQWFAVVERPLEMHELLDHDPTFTGRSRM